MRYALAIAAIGIVVIAGSAAANNRPQNGIGLAGPQINVGGLVLRADITNWPR